MRRLHDKTWNMIRLHKIMHNIHDFSVECVERSGYGLGIFGAGSMQDRR